MSDFIEKQIGYQIKAISEGLNDSARQCLNMLEKIENCQQSYKEVLKVFYCAQRITIPGQPVSDSNTEILEADLLEFEEFQQLEQLKQKLQEQIDLYQRQICFLNQISEKDIREGKIFLFFIIIAQKKNTAIYRNCVIFPVKQEVCNWKPKVLLRRYFTNG